MHNFTSTVSTVSTTVAEISTDKFLLYTLISIAFGVIIALSFRFRNKVSKGFSATLIMLPAIVQVVIMLVNGNLGTGVAVMGAFSLVRFRSVPGTARDICSIFLAMAVGLAMGTGYILIAFIFVMVICIVNILTTFIPSGKEEGEKQLVITIPESLDYEEIFDDLFGQYTDKAELVTVKTTNMGSLYKLTYHICLKNSVSEKAFIDDLRCRNGNLEISCGRKTKANVEQL